MSRFYFGFIKEICSRVPVNINLFNSIKYFAPMYCLKPTGRLQFESLPISFLDDNIDKGAVARQWDNILSINWNLPENITSEDFWVNYVLPYQNAAGVQVFQFIVEFAISALSLPLSNATVERVFY
jgi:hypothetical protein